MSSPLAAALKLLSRLLIAICSVLFCIAVVALTVDIILRWQFNSSITGLHEIIIIIFLYGFLFGAAALYVRREDVVLTFLIARLPERPQRALEALIQALVGITMALVTYYSVLLTIDWHFVRTPALGLPRSIEVAPVAICTFIITLSSIGQIWDWLHWVRTGATTKGINQSQTQGE